MVTSLEVERVRVGNARSMCCQSWLGSGESLGLLAHTCAPGCDRRGGGSHLAFPVSNLAVKTLSDMSKMYAKDE